MSAALSIPAEAILAERERRRQERSIPAKLRPLGKHARYKGLYGGRGGTKSHEFARRLIQRAVDEPGLRWVCLREIQKSLSMSVKKLLEDKIQSMGYSSRFRILHDKIETPGDGVILFQGMQNHTKDSLRSLEGFHGAWVEEAQNFSAASLQVLRPTLRREGAEMWFSWNPVNATDPVDAFFRGADGPPPGSVLVRLSWEDNPYLPEEMKLEAAWDFKRDPEQAAHVWGGEYQHFSEARVFRNWRVEEFETPAGVTFYHGADWGFAADPTVLMRCFVVDRTLYFDREAYAIGCEIEDTPALFDGLTCGDACMVPKRHSLVCKDKRDARGDCERHRCMLPGHGDARRWQVVADSARPETISYMQRHGYPKLEPAKKGPGSLEDGVTFLKGYDVVIHPRCKHAINEWTYYSYKVDELTGAVLPILKDEKNHVVDATRYAVEKLRQAVKTRAPRGVLN